MARPVLIQCDECASPVFSTKGKSLVIKAIHHGKRHVTTIDLDELFGQIAMVDGTLGRRVVEVPAS